MSQESFHLMFNSFHLFFDKQIEKASMELVRTALNLAPGHGLMEHRERISTGEP